MEDESLRMLKKISEDIESIKDDMRLMHRRISDVENSIKVVSDLHEDVENVHEEINRYFELRNPMS